MSNHVQLSPLDHLSPDPLGEALAACYRRMLMQIDIGEKKTGTPIISNALDGKEMTGASDNDFNKPLSMGTLPHGTLPTK